MIFGLLREVACAGVSYRKKRVRCVCCAVASLALQVLHRGQVTFVVFLSQFATVRSWTWSEIVTGDSTCPCLWSRDTRYLGARFEVGRSFFDGCGCAPKRFGLSVVFEVWLQCCRPPVAQLKHVNTPRSCSTPFSLLVEHMRAMQFSGNAAQISQFLC